MSVVAETTVVPVTVDVIVTVQVAGCADRRVGAGGAADELPGPLTMLNAIAVPAGRCESCRQTRR